MIKRVLLCTSPLQVTNARSIMDYLPKMIRLSVIKLYDAGIISEEKYLSVMVDHMAIVKDSYFHDYIVEILITIIADVTSSDVVFGSLYRDQYQQYLKTSAWADLKHQTKERDNYTCQSCKIRFDSPVMPMIEVHHKNYDNVYHELLSDLITLCRECHQLEHHKQ